MIEQGKRQQDQTVIFNSVWDMLKKVEQSKSKLESEQRDISNEYQRLRTELAQAQYTIALERSQYTAARNHMTAKDDLIQSLSREITAQQGLSNTLRQQTFLVNQALLITVQAPRSEESMKAFKDSLQAQMEDNDRLRQQVQFLTTTVARMSHSSYSTNGPSNQATTYPQAFIVPTYPNRAPGLLNCRPEQPPSPNTGAGQGSLSAPMIVESTKRVSAAGAGPSKSVAWHHKSSKKGKES